MAYIPESHKKYNILSSDGEVFDYPETFIEALDKKLHKKGFDKTLIPYNYKSYDDYFLFLDSVAKKYDSRIHGLIKNINQLKEMILKKNQKEYWSICKYIGDSEDETDLTKGKYYYWPTEKDNPNYNGVIDDEEFAPYQHDLSFYDWEIIEDPTGMAKKILDQELCREMNEDEKEITEVVTHTIEFSLDYFGIFSVDGSNQIINPDELGIDLEGDTSDKEELIPLNVPGLYEWYEEYIANSNITDGYMLPGFDLKGWHERGLFFAKEIRKQLPVNCILFYKAPYEDTSGIIKDKILIPVEPTTKKTFQDIYPRETLRKIDEIRISHEFGYNPIVFWYPELMSYTENGNEAMQIDKYHKELISLYDDILALVLKKYPFYLQHRWVYKGGYYKELEFTNSCHEEAKLYFWQLLKTSIKWKIFHKFFMELPVEEVALMNVKAENFNVYKPSNEPLFNACYKLDLDGIKIALKNGCEINSYNKDGDTPLVCALSWNDYFCFEDGRYDSGKFIYNEEDKEKLFSIVSFLLNNGADINLYGLNSCDALFKAYLTQLPELVEYLIQHGAKKDLNPGAYKFYEPWYENSWIYFDVEDCDPCVKNYEEMKELLIKYNFQYYTYGWDNDKIDEYQNQLAKDMLDLGNN